MAGTGPIGDLRLKGSTLGSRTSRYPYIALRGPTYRENSHANHTWHLQSQQTSCFKGSEAPPVWVRFPSPAPLPGNARPRRATRLGQGIAPMGKSWEIDAEGAAVSWPHVSPHCPEVHTYNHTQQFTENKLCDSHAALVARAIAVGWTRPSADGPKCPVSGSRFDPPHDKWCSQSNRLRRSVYR